MRVRTHTHTTNTCITGDGLVKASVLQAIPACHDLSVYGGGRGMGNSNLAISLSGNVDHAHMLAQHTHMHHTTHTHAPHNAHTHAPRNAHTHQKVGVEKRNVSVE